MGASWQSIQFVDSLLHHINYLVLDQELIGYYKGQLFHFEIDPIEGLQKMEELKNDGIENHEITSISKLDDQVFVTTLSGVYSKSITDFFDPKEE